MAKIRTYIRVAKTNRGYKVTANNKANYEPLYQSGYGSSKDFYPTVAFAVDFPEELFTQASQVIGEINIALKNANVAAEVQIPSMEQSTKRSKK